jgi:hypothetical protein
MEVVGYRQLGAIGTLIGKGGQGRVYLVPDVRLPDVPGPLVYKEYDPGQGPGQGLQPLVRFRGGLDPATRDRLDACTAWPVRVVEDDVRVRGILMRLIPPSFMQTRTLPGTGARQTGPREVQNLMVPPARALLVGMPAADPKQRLLVCRDLAAALYLLHKHEFVYGDLNARNEVFRLGERPSVLLVDCDAVRKRGSAAVVAQLAAPDWDAPERWPTFFTDRYKFGLFVLRCLGSGDQVSTTRDPARADAALDPEGRQLLRRALTGPPTDRPDLREWGRYLDFRLTGRRSSATPGVSVPVSSVPAQRPDQTTGWARDKVSGKWFRR